MKRKVVVLVLACSFLLAINGYILADPVSVTAVVAAATPLITSISLENASNSPVSVLDVNTEYHLHFTVTYNNAFIVMRYIRVTLTNSPGTTDRRDNYQFDLTTLLTQHPVWQCAQGGTYYLGDPSLGTYNWLANTNSFELHFRLDKIARPVGATRNWVTTITAQGWTTSSTDSSKTYKVNKYQEISAQTSSINFGSVNPGATLTRQNANVTIISNTQTDVQATGADLTTTISGTLFSIVVGQFNMQRDDGSGNIALTTSAQNIYPGLFGTSESVDTHITGYSNGYTRAISFGGTIPDPQPEGTYTGTWTIALNNGNVAPS